jgi:Xaa-Pro aminopeptidase
MSPAPPPPPPPPPPPFCLPFRGKKPKRVTTLAHSEKGSYSHNSYGSFPDSRNGSNYDLRRQDSYSPTATVNTKTSISKSAFISEDSDSYDAPLPVKEPSPSTPKRNDSKKWGYGWGVGKEKEREAEKHSAANMVRKDSGGSSSSAETLAGKTPSPGHPDRPNVSRQASSRSNNSRSVNRPGFHGNDSSSTLVGSALERKINDVDSVREKPDTGPRLEDLRKQMAKDNLDY